MEMKSDELLTFLKEELDRFNEDVRKLKMERMKFKNDANAKWEELRAKEADLNAARLELAEYNHELNRKDTIRNQLTAQFRNKLEEALSTVRVEQSNMMAEMETLSEIKDLQQRVSAQLNVEITEKRQQHQGQREKWKTERDQFRNGADFKMNAMMAKEQNMMEREDMLKKTEQRIHIEYGQKRDILQKEAQKLEALKHDLEREQQRLQCEREDVREHAARLDAERTAIGRDRKTLNNMRTLLVTEREKLERVRFEFKRQREDMSQTESELMQRLKREKKQLDQMRRELKKESGRMKRRAQKEKSESVTKSDADHLLKELHRIASSRGSAASDSRGSISSIRSLVSKLPTTAETKSDCGCFGRGTEKFCCFDSMKQSVLQSDAGSAPLIEYTRVLDELQGEPSELRVRTKSYGDLISNTMRNGDARKNERKSLRRDAGQLQMERRVFAKTKAQTQVMNQQFVRDQQRILRQLKEQRDGLKRQQIKLDKERTDMDRMWKLLVNKREKLENDRSEFEMQKMCEFQQNEQITAREQMDEQLQDLKGHSPLWMFNSMSGNGRVAVPQNKHLPMRMPTEVINRQSFGLDGESSRFSEVQVSDRRSRMKSKLSKSMKISQIPMAVSSNRSSSINPTPRMENAQKLAMTRKFYILNQIRDKVKAAVHPNQEIPERELNESEIINQMVREILQREISGVETFPPGGKHTGTGIIQFQSMSAYNLPKADLLSDSDPYVVFSNQKGQSVQTEKVKNNSEHPVWNEHLMLSVNENEPISIEIYDWNKITADELLCSLTLDVGSICKDGQEVMLQELPMTVAEQYAKQNTNSTFSCTVLYNLI